MAASKCAASPTVLDLTKCDLCNELFSDPKLLPCLHSFCTGCLTKHCRNQKGLVASNAACPTCSATFTVPVNGVHYLPTNNLAKRLVELKKVSSQGGANCGACLENTEKAPATVYCHDCEQHLCVTCNSIHKRLKASSSHKVLTIGDNKGLLMEDLVKSHVEMCPQHPQERATLYCSSCLKVICTVCFVAQHKAHACQDVVSAAEGIRSQLKRSVELLSNRGEEYKSERKELQRQEQMFLTGISEAQKRVREKVQEAKRMIDEQQDELLQKLDQLKEEKLAAIGRSENWFGTSMSSIEYSLQFVLDVLSKGSNGDVVGQYGDMHRRLEGLLKDKPGTVTQDSVAFRVSTVMANQQYQDFSYEDMQQQAQYDPYSGRRVLAQKGLAQHPRIVLQNRLGGIFVTSTARVLNELNEEATIKESGRQAGRRRSDYYDR